MVEPGLALLRKRVRENWTDKNRNVARKIFLEGGWTQKRLFDFDWFDTSQCQACKKRKGQNTTAQNGTKPDERFQKFLRSWSKKTRTSKKEWNWQRGVVTHQPMEQGSFKLEKMGT